MASISNKPAQLNTLLEHIDPDSGGYGDWMRVLMAIYHETGGSDDGLEIADAWSSKGSLYKGTREISAKWRSFRSNRKKPITIGTLIYMARQRRGRTG